MESVMESVVGAVVGAVSSAREERTDSVAIAAKAEVTRASDKTGEMDDFMKYL